MSPELRAAQSHRALMRAATWYVEPGGTLTETIATHTGELADCTACIPRTSGYSLPTHRR